MGRVFGMTRGYDGVVHWADGSGKHKGHFKLKDILEFKPVKPGKTKRKWHYFGIVVQEPDTNSLEPCRTYNLCSEASVYHTKKADTKHSQAQTQHITRSFSSKRCAKSHQTIRDEA